MAEAPSPTTQIQLRLLFAETHPSSPPRLEVRLNSFEKSIQTPKGTNPEYLDTKETTSKELSVTLDIPADEFRAGNNTLTIRNISGSWVAFDQIKLTSDSPLQTNNLTTKASLVSSAFSPVLVVGKKKELRQPVKIKAVNWHHKRDRWNCKSVISHRKGIRIVPRNKLTLRHPFRKSPLHVSYRSY